MKDPENQYTIHATAICSVRQLYEDKEGFWSIHNMDVKMNQVLIKRNNKTTWLSAGEFLALLYHSDFIGRILHPNEIEDTQQPLSTKNSIKLIIKEKENENCKIL